MNMQRKGRVWKYGDDVSTDVIFPGRYVYTLMSDACVKLSETERTACLSENAKRFFSITE